MRLHPIIASLGRHKLTAGLLVLQTALTCAIVANALPLLVTRIARIGAASGVDEDRLSFVAVSATQKGANHQAEHDADLAALRRIAGVQSAVVIGDGVPLAGGIDAYGVCTSAAAWQQGVSAGTFDHSECVQPDVYSGSPGFIQTLGLRLIEGTDFRADDYVTGPVHTAILTRSLAAHLFPGQSALGRTLFRGEQPIRVVGIVDDVLRPMLRNTEQDHNVMLWPQLPDSSRSTYLLRTTPQDRDRVLKAATDALINVNPYRLFPESGRRTYSDLRHQYFHRDVTMMGLLVASSASLLFVTALGVAGLANVWVQQRTRQIGIRRALGATRRQILRDVQLENFLLTTVGIALGIAGAYGISVSLMQHYELPRLPAADLPFAALAFWLLGQFAVLGPALRAAAVPPVVATRGG